MNDPDMSTSPLRERPDRRHGTRRGGRSARAEGSERRRAGERRVVHLGRPLEVNPAAVQAARRVLVLAALTVVVVDLVDKAVSPTLPSAYHARGPAAAAGMAAMVVVGAW